ncbi:MAG: preprotein translocase subunit SecE [Saprospiraceae bacterium]|nr:preprotein translocase subunit SecE [Saprospiraceae bacterium]
MDNLVLYIKESYNELINKVTWPTWSELIATTNIVIIASLIIAGIIFLMDLVSKQVLNIIYNLG